MKAWPAAPPRQTRDQNHRAARFRPGDSAILFMFCGCCRDGRPKHSRPVTVPSGRAPAARFGGGICSAARPRECSDRLDPLTTSYDPTQMRHGACRPQRPHQGRDKPPPDVTSFQCEPLHAPSQVRCVIVNDRVLRWGEMKCPAPLPKPMPCAAALSEVAMKDRMD